MIHHVTGHSHPRAAAFPDDAAMRGFLALLAETATRLEWRVLAYALLSTHYHLLLQTQETNLGTGMRHLHGRHAQLLNSRLGNAGPLWRDRFHSRPVETGEHVVRAAAYIDMNAVAAGICADPAECHWSSYRANAGLVEPPHWHRVDLLYSYLGAPGHEAAEVYRELVATSIDVIRSRDGD